MDALDIFLKDRKQEQFNIDEYFYIKRVYIDGIMIFHCINGVIEFSARDKRVVRSWVNYQTKVNYE